MPWCEILNLVWSKCRHVVARVACVGAVGIQERAAPLSSVLACPEARGATSTGTVAHRWPTGPA